MKTAFIGLGSNLGDRRSHLAEALRCLAADPLNTIVTGSSLYESKPVGLLEQPDFLNLVVQIATAHSPLGLLAGCLEVEARLGRERRVQWGPRTIDLDVLAYDQLPWSDERLVLPHPRMHERGFVLTPLAEIAPDFEVYGETARVLADRVGHDGLRCVALWRNLADSAGIVLPAAPAR